MEIGTRVGALLSADEKTVHLLGYGVYEGDHVPPEGMAGLGQMCHENNIKNPRILLDNGNHVFGCECWWGPEEKVKEQIGDREVIQEDILAVRKEAAEETEEE